MKGFFTTRSICLMSFLLLFSFLGFSEEHAFSITFNYDFDNGYFSEHPERKAVLEAAGDLYSTLFSSDFPDIPEGTEITYLTDYDGEEYTIVLDEAVDDLLIFVEAFDLGPEGAKAYAGPTPSSSIGDDSWQRFHGNPFQPWIGYIVINTNPSRPWFFDQSPENSNDLPSRTHYDFYSTALHEMGHILGVIKNSSPFAYTDLTKGDFFYGPHTVSLLEGNPLPLEKDSSHFDSSKVSYGLYRPHLEEHLMNAISPLQGFRFFPTILDLAVFQDIGYEVNYDNLPIADDAPSSLYPRKTQFDSLYSEKDRSDFPIGLWYFEEKSDLNNAVIGYSLKYIASSLPYSHSFEEGGLLVPQGDYWIVDHGIESNEDIGTFSLVYEVLLPDEDSWYSLYNANAWNNNDGDAFVYNRRIGQGSYSISSVPYGEWVEFVLTVNKEEDTRIYYVNQELVYSQDGAQYSRYLLNGPSHPWFLLFADDDGEDSDILVRRVALFDYVLSTDSIENGEIPGWIPEDDR